MNKFIIIIFSTFILISCKSQPEKGLTVMTWNIWHGGLHGPKTNNFEQDTSNTINVLKVLEKENPDILFMQETYCCGMDIVKEAGYPYSLRASTNLSIHSKFPIIDSLDIYKPFNSHGAIVDVNGTPILCVNIWLHYLPDAFHDIITLSPDSLIAGEWDTRLSEIKQILRELDSIQQIYQLPIIISGDFNSGSHLDWVEANKEIHYNKVVEWPVSKMMIDNGFKDSFREFNDDPTSHLEGTWGFLNNDIISDRIDYIYCKGENIRVKSSKIVMDDPEDGFFNSDHRAILTKFLLN